MNGELALLATLAAVGGRWLRRGSDAAPPALLPGNSSFQYVGSFAAELPATGLLRRRSSAASPETWLGWLQDHGATDLVLISDLRASGTLPAHAASAFSNSGTWALLATGATPRLWNLTWAVGDRDAPGSRIWSIVARSADAAGVRSSTVTVDEARTQLRAALEAIHSFAESTSEVSSWAPWFATALRFLDDPDPAPPYHQDLVPPDATLPRRQLAAAAIQGWVFGGMGSWNDGGCADPVDQRNHDLVSAALYDALLVAVAAAANGA